MMSDETQPWRVEIRSPGNFGPTSDTIKVMTMTVRKSLVFPLVALPGVRHMPATGEDEQDSARVFYMPCQRRLISL